jgi:predicted AAA+ superfamily ATPase
MAVVNRTIFPLLKNALTDDRIIVITGMRRVGKTTTLKWLLDQVNSTNKLYLDLERLDQRAVFEQSNYDEVLSYFRNLGFNTDQPLTVALDEIQTVKNIPSVVKYLYDHYGIKFILSGSSSYYLKNLFTESMAGRKVVYELYPLGFGEFLDFRGIPYRRRDRWQEMQFNRIEFDRLREPYDEFITYGGLPSVVLEPRPEAKREILNDILSSYINIDVTSLTDFRKINELKTLLQILPMRIGNKLDLSKLSKIVGVSRPTLNGYLEFLEMTYMIAQLPAHARPDKAAALGRKLYFCDNGIASILENPGEGALFENAVFNQLKAYGVESYYSITNEAEIDFIMGGSKSPQTALEVKVRPVETDRKKLTKLAGKAEISQSWIVGRYPTPGFESFLWGGSIL